MAMCRCCLLLFDVLHLLVGSRGWALGEQQEGRGGGGSASCIGNSIDVATAWDWSGWGFTSVGPKLSPQVRL
jgi:hypothetical protein